MDPGHDDHDARMGYVDPNDEEMTRYSDDEDYDSPNEGPAENIAATQKLAEFDDSDKHGAYRVQKWSENTETWRWKVENISTLPKSIRSPIFHVNGEPWQIFLFPQGNGGPHLALYLDVATPEKPVGWARYAEFSLGIVNQLDYKKTERNNTEKRFGKDDNDWGFREFMHIERVYDRSKGFYVNDTLIIEATICVRKEPYFLNPYNYNSRKETGLVGITNQGATCYLNSLLQSLYHLGHFRKALYLMPSEADVKGSNNIPLALQRVFWMLHQDDDAADTRELTKAFGWDTVDSFLQHDVQELARVLSDNLEEKMKGTEVEGTMSYLFEGKIKNYIKCVNIDYESTREEPFYDLQLNVVNCQDVYDSFRKYTETEMLEGDNKYQAEGHGLQDAKKGCIFKKFPPVLMLHLKRFEYDFIQDVMYKVNDRYEFFDEINLRNFAEPEESETDEDFVYRLYSVLVHSGDVSGGHYYAFIRPSASDGQWFKFDDEHVYKVSSDVAIEDNFGGEPRNQVLPFLRRAPLYKSYSNAYMLIYIRKKDADNILKPVADDDIPQIIKDRFAFEKEEEQRLQKQKAEAHRYVDVRLLLDKHFAQHHEQELYPYLTLEPIRVLKTEKAINLKRQISKPLNIDPENIRLWRLAMRKNNTFRPDVPIRDDEMMKLDEPHPCLYVEASPEGLTPLTKDSVLLFVKQFDPCHPQLNYVGSLIAQSNDTTEILNQKICKQILNVSPEIQLDMSEEVKPDNLEAFQPGQTLEMKQIKNGDIVVIQEPLTQEQCEQLPFPTIEDYYNYLINRIMIKFARLDNIENEETQFVLEMLRDMRYDEVVEVVAKQLNVDPQYIRLTGNTLSQRPRVLPFKTTDAQTLNDMIISKGKITNILYYEILSIPVTEIESKTPVSVSYFGQNVQEVKRLDLLLEHGVPISTLFEEVKKSVELETEHKKLRLLEVYNSRVHKLLDQDTSVEMLGSSIPRVEEISDEEFEVGPNDAVVMTVHFNKSNRVSGMTFFGNPFYFAIHEGETLKEVKDRIRQKLQVPQKEFDKWKFSVVSMMKAYPLEDDSVVLDEMKARKKYGGEPSLGLEHRDTTPKAADRWYNRPIVIRN